MSDNQSLQRFLGKAKEKESRYDWLSAVESHRKALHLILKQKSFLEAGKVQERIGYCFHRGAMQAENHEQFKERMQRAIKAYDEAQEFYYQIGVEQEARMFRCKANSKYLGSWLTSEPSEKKSLLDECLEFEEKALTIFLKAGDMLEYGRTYNELPLVFLFRLHLEWKKRIRESIAKKGIEWGKKAVTELLKLDKYETARTYLTLATFLNRSRYFIADPSVEENRLESVKYMSEAIGLPDFFDDPYLLGLMHLWLGTNLRLNFSAHQHFKKTLECGKQTRDNFLIAWGLDFLTYSTYWRALSEEDPDVRRELVENAMQFYEQSQHHYSVISFISPRGGFMCIPSGYAEHYRQLSLWEIDPQKKLQFIKKSEKSGIEALKQANRSDMPNVIIHVLHVLSKTLETRALLEPDHTEKRVFLEKALENREKGIKIHEEFEPYYYWNRGVMQNYLAEIKAKLADTETNLRRKRELLEDAVLTKEKCFDLIMKIMPHYPTDFIFGPLQEYQDSYSTLLTQLYDFTGKPEHLEKAIETLQKIIESANQLEKFSIMAESQWKIAKIQDTLGEHLNAAENFQNALKSYNKASEKIPLLNAIYQDYASYMKAWSEIERAKHHHTRKQYEQAKKHYEEAANIHNLTERWKYLSPNYLAWARLEEAEYFSRGERTEDAKESFQGAARVFLDAKASIEARIESIEDTSEKELAHDLVKASNIRHRYCLGRRVLEEARLLDRRGQHLDSSVKYGVAASIFQEVSEALEEERDRREIAPIIKLSEAWQVMTQAEAEVSPELYLKASELFEEAKDHSTDERARVLAVGHSIFCRALESGTRFETTRDEETYAEAKKLLVAAENYYVKAGFQNSSEYARATHRLLDAYWYIYQAETEMEPDRKSQFYQLSAKLLETSVDSYQLARHPEKTEQVQRLLEKVLEEQKLTTALTEIMHTPNITLSTESFVSPSQTFEKAVGSERFDDAHVEGKITLPEHGTVGDTIEYRFDIVNVGKNNGLLIRIDDLTPPSFKVNAVPPQYKIENGALDLRGRNLGPLKSESIKLDLQTSKPGSIKFSPRITYIDEAGTFKSCKPEPATIVVQSRSTFEFKSKNAKSVFDFLLQSFIEDYMRKRMSTERSGWRSLMEVVKDGKLPKSSVYGARGQSGRALAELERRGLVETRIFTGERGRGGRVLRVRVAYDKDTIKRYIDQHVMKK
jgi:hypothetical protein